MTERSTKRPLKFQRRADARPDEVLDAALEMFTEKGFAATRVEDIAVRAGVSKGTVYLYFASKEALLEALVRRAIVPVANSALASISDFEGDPRDIIGLVLKSLSHRLADPAIIAVPKVVLREMAAFPHLAAMYRSEVLDLALPVVTGLIRKGIDSGYLRAVDPELTVRSIVGPVMVHVLLDEVFGIAPAGGLEIDRFIDNHLSILFHGISAVRAS